MTTLPTLPLPEDVSGCLDAFRASDGRPQGPILEPARIWLRAQTAQFAPALQALLTLDVDFADAVFSTCTGLEIQGPLAFDRGVSEREYCVEFADNLRCLPDGLRVLGDLYIDALYKMETLPRNLFVRGDLTLLDCDEFRTLPEGLVVEAGERGEGGGLAILGVSAWDGAIPNDARIAGEISFRKNKDYRHWTAIHSVSLGQWRWTERIKASAPTFIKAWSSGEATAPKNAFLALSELRPGKGSLEGSSLALLLRVLLELDLGFGNAVFASLEGTGLPWEDPSITDPDSRYWGKWRSGEIIMGNLDLRECPGLDAIPGGIVIQGDLNLDRCEHLRILGKGIRVIGSLVLSGCNSLESIGDDLIVGERLVLTGCARLKSLPNGISVGNHFEPVTILDLEGCSLWDGKIPSKAELPKEFRAPGGKVRRTRKGLLF